MYIVIVILIFYIDVIKRICNMKKFDIEVVYDRQDWDSY